MTMNDKKNEQTLAKNGSFWSAFVRARSIDASRLVNLASRRHLQR